MATRQSQISTFTMRVKISIEQMAIFTTMRRQHRRLKSPFASCPGGNQRRRHHLRLALPSPSRPSSTSMCTHLNPSLPRLHHPPLWRL